MVSRRLKKGVKKAAKTTKQGASQAKQDLQSLAEQRKQVTDQETARIQRAKRDAQKEAKREAQQEFRKEYKEELQSELREEEIMRLRKKHGLADEDDGGRGGGLQGLGMGPPQRGRREQADNGRDDQREERQMGIPLGPPKDSGMELRFMGETDDDRGFF